MGGMASSRRRLMLKEPTSCCCWWWCVPQAALVQREVTFRFVRAIKWVMESGRDGPPPEDGKDGRPASFSRRHPSSCGSSNGSFTSLFNFSSPAQQPPNTNDGTAAGGMTHHHHRHTAAAARAKAGC